MRYFIVLILTLLQLRAGAQNDFCGIHNTAFAEGEHLLFRAYYNMSFIWVAAGDANFNVSRDDYNGRDAYHIVGDGKTLKSYEWFYKVRDRYETYLDVNTMLPMHFIRDVNEGGLKFKNDVVFNQMAGKATSLNGTFNVPKCAQDVLSSIYYARNIDFNKYKPGDKIPFTMFLDDQVYNLFIRYLGKEKIETRYGTFNTIKISPLLISGTIFKDGEKMKVWVTDDANHLPVRVESPIIIGSVKVDLMGFDHLRNPATALIKKK